VPPPIIPGDERGCALAGCRGHGRKVETTPGCRFKLQPEEVQGSKTLIIADLQMMACLVVRDLGFLQVVWALENSDG
jgi:hypothetical protein